MLYVAVRNVVAPIFRVLKKINFAKLSFFLDLKTEIASYKLLFLIFPTLYSEVNSLQIFFKSISFNFLHFFQTFQRELLKDTHFGGTSVDDGRDWVVFSVRIDVLPNTF